MTILVLVPDGPGARLHVLSAAADIGGVPRKPHNDRMDRDGELVELYERAGAGEPGALDALLIAYLPRLRAFVRARMDQQLRQRESCSDLVQSVCRELVAVQANFEFRGEAQFRGWLFTAALNKVREKHRFHHAARRDPARENAPSSEGAAPSALAAACAESGTPSAMAMRNEELDRLEAAFDRLSEDHREVVTLTRLCGLPHGEVAILMNRSLDAVQKLLGRALLELGKILDA